MKVLLQLVFLLLLPAALNTLVSAQTPTPTPQKIEFIEPPDLNNYKDWKKVYFSEFSIYVPQYFKFEDIWTIHGGLSGYQDDDFKITVYLSTRSIMNPASDDNQTFRERIVVIDNDWAFLSSFEFTNKEVRYVNRAYFFLRNAKYSESASITITSKDKQKGKDLAEKIFYSLKYEKEPPIGEPPPIIRKPAKEIKEKTVKKGKP